MQQRVRRNAASDRHRYKCRVQLPICHSRLQSGIAALVNIHLDLGILLLHPQHNVRHPIAAHAAEYAHIQDTGTYITDPHDLLLQPLLRLQRIADMGDQLLTVLGQPQAIAVADHQLHSQPFLQLSQRMAHRRWCQVYDLRRLCQAVGAGHQIKNTITDVYHKHPPFFPFCRAVSPVTVVTLTVRRVFFDTLLCKIQHGLNLFHFVIVAFLRELGKCGGT